jgi:quercetin dioxygenase-like cupin family protein
MIVRPITEEERKKWPREVIVRLEKAFADARGQIQPLVDLPMESCVLITSRKDSVRANHYHRTDWHFCYVLSGSIEYYERPHGSNEPPKRVLVKAGELFFTAPMVDHAMVFPEETVFLTLGRNSRTQEAYEADVVRIPPIHGHDHDHDHGTSPS